MKTLKQLCEENKLPFRVRKTDWKVYEWFEVVGVREGIAIGFYEDNSGVSYFTSSTKSNWELYTEPKPKKVLKPFMIRSGGRSVEVEWFESEEVAVKWTFGACIGPAKGMPDLEIEE